MASRLFNAIVGIGISLGTTSVVACSSRVIARQQADDPAAEEPAPLASAAPVTPATDAAPVIVGADAGDATAPEDASADGAVVDGDASDAAPLDAAHDARFDAFCDAAWPTTKGTPTPCL